MKPEPEPLLHALAELGVEGALAAYIGDTEEDMQAALAAGVAVRVGVTVIRSEQQLREAGATAVCRDLFAVRALFDAVIDGVPGARALCRGGVVRERARMSGAASGRSSLAGLLGQFGRLGATAFGGPAAHVAMMEDEFVQRRRWLDRDTFARVLAATNLVPGPNSTEMAIHLGYRRRGVPGAIASGSAFILPAALAVAALAWAYFQWGTTPRADDLFAGIRPAVVVLVALAAWRLRGPAQRNPLAMVLASAAFAVALLAPRWEVIATAPAPAWSRCSRASRDYAGGSSALLVALPCAAAPAGAARARRHAARGRADRAHSPQGRGAALRRRLRDHPAAAAGRRRAGLAHGVAVPRRDRDRPGDAGADRHHRDLVGYAAGGWWGALIATVAIFAPAFVFAISLGRLLDGSPRPSRCAPSSMASAAAVFGAIAGAAVVLLTSLDANPLSAVVLAASGVVLLRSLLPSYAWLAVCGAGGLLYHATGLPA